MLTIMGSSLLFIRMNAATSFQHYRELLLRITISSKGTTLNRSDIGFILRQKRIQDEEEQTLDIISARDIPEPCITQWVSLECYSWH